MALPLIETHCEFKRPVLYNIELIVHSEVVLLKEKVFRLSHQFYCEDQLVAEGYEVRVWASTAEGRKGSSNSEEVKNKL
ncbi:hypothetical protein KEH51_27530 [[Brevibacterium] frigoritolerans]|uniref:Thioesterase domain-containing protein n=1 Tax=Peribacillus frigoritolerans TaxID=450367 RepID=A0A941FSU4_9BACI|nr:hypothetical protein [Peribacillus frigoritolerans]